ncbi:mycofactocin system transcriptional regulator [Amnibacterium sp.]|uniref:mycofactocin system transcriptional regulator n=1 Tax=Amnibacterium sp. TaxID=1872496 RepID=UPI003F7BE8B3
MSDDPVRPETPQRLGRQPVTTVAELSHIGLELFIRNGFDATTVDDIAEAAGIGRRTFFRYFSSKNDLPWGDFDGLIAAMRDHLMALPPDVPLRQAIRDAVLRFNEFPDVEVSYHRQRMTLLLTVPTLVGHSTLRFAAWRQAVAGFVASRLGLDPDDLVPKTIAYTYLAVSIAAYERWLLVPDAVLTDLLAEALDDLGDAFGGVAGA